MKWPSVIFAFAIVGIVGCPGPRVGIDPFGRTTIPPPPTGAVQPGAVDPYYGNQPAAPPPLVPLPYQQSSTGSANYDSANAASTRSDRWTAAGTNTAPTSNSPSTTESAGRLRPIPTFIDNMSSGTASGVSLTAGNPDAWSNRPTASANFNQPISSTAPAAGNTATISGGTGIEYRPAPSIPAARVDMSNLPAATSRTSGGITTTRLKPSEPELVPGRFGNAADYGWLKGRLQYVAGQRQWELQYQDADMLSDQYGGRVVLSSHEDLHDFKSGDYVLVRGRLGGQQSQSRDFAQAYTVSSLTRQK